jgi:hypothetical protein
MSELQNSLWRGRVSKDIMLAYAQMGTPKATYTAPWVSDKIFIGSVLRQGPDVSG